MKVDLGCGVPAEQVVQIYLRAVEEKVTCQNLDAAG
jgi:hypothetical protein